MLQVALTSLGPLPGEDVGAYAHVTMPRIEANLLPPLVVCRPALTGPRVPFREKKGKARNKSKPAVKLPRPDQWPEAIARCTVMWSRSCCVIFVPSRLHYDAWLKHHMPWLIHGTSAKIEVMEP